MPFTIAALLLVSATPSMVGAQAPAAGGATCDGLSSAQMKKLQSTYRGRVMLQGRAKADAWLKGECGAAANEVAEQAADRGSPRKTSERAKARSGREQRDKKGCRLVMRPIATLGGAMTMAQVPVCDKE
ncbi:MAG: hypothetical protein K0S66_2316 [Sphingomonas sp.]|jgi:hypothetical protein|nr:hypothetical protein [Sphingomonas sp.]